MVCNSRVLYLATKAAAILPVLALKKRWLNDDNDDDDLVEVWNVLFSSFSPKKI